MANTLLKDSNRFDFLKVVKRLQDSLPAEKDPSLDEVRKECFRLVSGVL